MNVPNFPYQPVSRKVKNLKAYGKRELYFDMACNGFIAFFAIIGIISFVFQVTKWILK